MSIRRYSDREQRARRSHLALILAIASVLILIPWTSHADQKHLQDAVQLMEQGDLTGAESRARIAMEDPANRPVAYAILGAIRLQQSKYDESARFLETALELNPRLIGARLNLGNVYALQGKSNQAEISFRQVLKLDPSNFNARFDLARLENEAGHFAASMSLATPVIGELRHSDEGLVLIASDSLALDDRNQLPTVLANWFALDHPASAASLSLAEAFASHGLLKDAISILEHSKTQDEGSFDLYYYLGGYYFKQGDLDQASVNLKLALGLKQDCTECLFQLSRISEQQLNLDEALGYSLKAKEYSPDDPDILFEVGRICAKKNLYIDAIENLSKAVQLRPDNDSFKYVLASAYTGKKDYKNAIPILENLVSLHPNDPVLNYSLGAVQYLDSDLADADRVLQISIKLDPKQVASYYYLGLTKNRAGETDEAEQILQSLADRHPDHAATFAALGGILLEQHKYPEAQSALERAIQLDSSFVKAHYQLGIVLGRLGQSDASEKEFAIVKSLNKEADQQTEMQIFSPSSPN
jgi:tetratricopeptide (TPR) repeat protein